MTYAIVSTSVFVIGVLTAGIWTFRWTRNIKDGIGASLLTLACTLPFLLWYLGAL